MFSSGAPKERLAAAAPTYLKSHSMGEYVFDHGWADAYQRAGLDYYPKLQVAVPFTPVTGRRLLIAPGHGEAARQTLIAGLRALRDKTEASSIHVTFPTKADWNALGSAGFLKRTDQQFHFLNRGYADFEAFLNDLASRKRKMIRRERKDALANGIEIEALTGADISERHWDAFFRVLYGHRRPQMGASLSDARLFLGGRRVDGGPASCSSWRNAAGRYIAGAINFIGRDALYGRNWGAIEDHPFLHFEVCYYQAIEFAIARGPRPRRGRRAGRTQARARLWTRRDLFGA